MATARIAPCLVFRDSDSMATVFPAVACIGQCSLLNMTQVPTLLFRRTQSPVQFVIRRWASEEPQEKLTTATKEEEEIEKDGTQYFCRLLSISFG